VVIHTKKICKMAAIFNDVIRKLKKYPISVKKVQKHR